MSSTKRLIPSDLIPTNDLHSTPTKKRAKKGRKSASVTSEAETETEPEAEIKDTTLYDPNPSPSPPPLESLPALPTAIVVPPPPTEEEEVVDADLIHILEQNLNKQLEGSHDWVNVKQLDGSEVMKYVGHIDKLNRDLAKRLDCTNLYWTDVDWTKAAFATKYISSSKGTSYGSISQFNRKTQRAFGQQITHGGVNIMLPMAILSKSYQLPHGNLDHIPDPTNTDDIGKPQFSDQCKIQVGIRPTAYNHFTCTEDGSTDIPVLAALAFIQQWLEPRIQAAIEVMEDSARFSGPLRTCTASMKNPLSLCLFAERSILRDLQVDRFPQDKALFVKKNKEDPAVPFADYKTFTKLLTELCHKARPNLKVEKGFDIYRLTTNKEREDDPTIGQYIKLEWNQHCAVQEEDLASLIINIAIMKKAVPKLKITLEGLVWYGKPALYTAMTENTLEQFLLHVPSTPLGVPSKETMWFKKEGTAELATVKTTVAQYLALKDEQAQA